MSFSIEFYARSRAHALRQLEIYNNSAPGPVVAFIKAAIENQTPLREGATRIFYVKAHGHLCDRDGSYAVSNAEILVRPIDIPD